MTILKSDTFSVGSDTAIETYDSDWAGGDYTDFTVYNGTPDQLRKETGGAGKMAALSISPSSANYYMQVTGRQTATGGTSARFGPVVRHNGAVLASADCYYYFIRDNGTYQFGYFSAGSQNSISDTTITAVTYSINTDYDVQLRIGETSSDSYECLMGLAGGSLTTETSGTDSNITATGNPGVYMQDQVEAYVTAYEAADYTTAGGGNSNLLLMGVG